MRWLTLLLLLAFTTRAADALPPHAVARIKIVGVPRVVEFFKDNRTTFQGEPLSLALSRDGSRALIGSDDGHVWRWDTKGPEAKRITKTPLDGWPHCVAISADGNSAACGLMAESRKQDNMVALWNPITRDEPLTCMNARMICRVEFTPDAKRLLASGFTRDWKVYEFDTTDGKVRASYPSHTYDMIGGATLSPDGKLVAVTGEDVVTRIYDRATGKELRQLPVGAEVMRFTTDSKFLLAIAFDSKSGLWRLRRWPTDTWKEDLILADALGSQMPGSDISPDGKFAVFGGKGEVMRLSDGQVAFTALTYDEVHDGKLINTCAFSPDSKRFATACSDGTVTVWNAETIDKK